jgi:hypothetical protein
MGQAPADRLRFQAEFVRLGAVAGLGVDETDQLKRFSFLASAFQFAGYAEGLLDDVHRPIVVVEIHMKISQGMKAVHLGRFSSLLPKHFPGPLEIKQGRGVIIDPEMDVSESLTEISVGRESGHRALDVTHGRIEFVFLPIAGDQLLKYLPEIRPETDGRLEVEFGFWVEAGVLERQPNPIMEPGAIRLGRKQVPIEGDGTAQLRP